jgi:cysteine desulfurase
MGQDDHEAFSAIRITVGKDTTEKDVDGFLDALSTAVAQLRELSPLGPASPAADSGRRSAIS